MQSEYLFVTVIVGNAGNLTDPRRRQRIHSMVEQFESMPECSGQRFTYFWMRDYERFLLSSDIDVQMDEDSRAEWSPYSSQSIQEFLEWSENKIWGAFIVFDNHTNRFVQLNQRLSAPPCPIGQRQHKQDIEAIS